MTDARSQAAGIAALREIAALQAGLGGACACTCPRAAHEHFRAGSDCGRCGKAACPAYRPARRRARRFRIIFWRNR